jgi:hypothetical protein
MFFVIRNEVSQLNGIYKIHAGPLKTQAQAALVMSTIPSYTVGDTFFVVEVVEKYVHSAVLVKKNI